jgi:hypothetical protein
MLCTLLPLVRSIAIALVSTSLIVALLGATPGPLGSSTLVIFPFRVAEGMDPGIGVEYGTKLGASITALGGITVVMGEPATDPAAYLRTTKADGGDYYVSGFVAPPLNETAAVIEQLVSARSGVIVWSGNASIRPDIDIHDEGSVVKNALLAHASRGYVSIINPVSEPSEVPPSTSSNRNAKPSNGGPGSTIAIRPLPLPNESYEPSPKPTSQPKLYASLARPSRFVVLDVAGQTVTSSVRSYAVSSLISALARHGQTVAQASPITTILPVVRGPEICAKTGGAYLVFGSLEAQVTPASSSNDFIGWATANLSVVAYDCQNQKFVQSTKPLRGSGSVLRTAIDRAADSAVTNYLLKVVARAS